MDLGETYKYSSILRLLLYTEHLTEGHRLRRIVRSRSLPGSSYRKTHLWLKSRVQQLSGFFLAPDDPRTRSTSSLSSLAVFAAAQNMIYAGLEVCGHMVDHFGDTLGKWHELKEQFAAAEKDEAVSSEADEHGG